MLIQLSEDCLASSFLELFTHTVKFINKVKNNKKTTVVFGPITSSIEEEFEKNVSILLSHSIKLSEEDWAVLDLTSFQSAIDRIIKKRNIIGYPYAILDEFTVPLIKEKCFHTVHFRENYYESLGATIEHDKTIESNIPVVYLD